jgi:hypothetical protein
MLTLECESFAASMSNKDPQSIVDDELRFADRLSVKLKEAQNAIERSGSGSKRAALFLSGDLQDIIKKLQKQRKSYDAQEMNALKQQLRDLATQIKAL